MGAGIFKQSHTTARNFCSPATRQNEVRFAATDCSNNVATHRVQHSLHNSLLITCQQILRLPTTTRGKAKPNYSHSNDSISISEQKKVHRALCGGRGRPVWAQSVDTECCYSGSSTCITPRNLPSKITIHTSLCLKL